MTFWNDDVPLMLADFGADLTIGGVPARGIFDAAWDASEMGLGMAGAQPTVTLASADVPASPVGVSVVLPAGSYRVAEARPDGTGITTLLLHRA